MESQHTGPSRRSASHGKGTRPRISEADARKVEPFGGPIYRNKTYVPVACKENEGMNELGQIFWDPKNTARYIYVLEAGSANPGVTPNLDLPEGTIWRLDTLATEKPLTPGVRYGETPPGTFQSFPATGRAPALTPGKTYFLYAAFDIGLRVAGCLFTYQGE